LRNTLKYFRFRTTKSLVSLINSARWMSTCALSSIAAAESSACAFVTSKSSDRVSIVLRMLAPAHLNADTEELMVPTDDKVRSLRETLLVIT